ncbi:MAG: FtsX-like permease family protein [Gemmatimonadetes bacterium]|nr:FtsX-like permease family protein [Gemmatimonadota bacterium]
MFKNYLIIAIRNLLKYKLYSAINIIGLGIGIGCVILIGLFVQNELAVNTQHPHIDRLYRIIGEYRSENGQKTYDWRISGAIGPTLARDFPEVEISTRTMLRQAWVQHEDKVLNRVFCLADPNCLDVFNFPIIQGDKTALLQHDSVFIIESMAHDYFGDQDPIGKVFTIESGFIGGDYTVAGVLKDLPRRSSIRFDMLSASVRPAFLSRYWNAYLPTAHWRGSITVHVRLKENTSVEKLALKMPAMVEQYMGPEMVAHTTYHFQPIDEVHLYSRRDYGLRDVSDLEGPVTYGNIAHVYAASATAILIFLIAGINFINLTTARSANRAREVGLRKVVGAHRGQLALQFLAESVIFSVLSLIVGLVVISNFLPHFNDYTGNFLTLDITGNMVLALVGLSLITGLLTGIYPAFLLSRFRPVEVLKGTLAAGARGGLLRKVLVIFQFSTSIALIVITLVVFNQMSYIQNKNLGFDKEYVIESRLLWESRNSRLREDRLWERYNVVKDAFLQHPNITTATISRSSHGRTAPQATFSAYEPGKEELRMGRNEVDEDFLSFFNIELVAGRDFSEDAAKRYDSESFVPRDQLEQLKVHGQAEYILNETAVKMLGWTDPIGKPFGVKGRRPGRVVGVVKDFHSRTLHEPLGPVVLYANNAVPKTLYLKVSPHNFDETMAHMEKVWKHFLPIRPFAYTFMDDNLNQRYTQERQLSQTMSVFAALAIFVACLGLLGLVSFLTEQRKKEVGIRKVLGASAGLVVGLFLKEFIRLVLVSCLLAWPIAYWATNEWLQNFAYRIEISALPFLIGGAFMVALTTITVAYRVIKAAHTNPIEILRHE